MALLVDANTCKQIHCVNTVNVNTHSIIYVCVHVCLGYGGKACACASACALVCVYVLVCLRARVCVCLRARVCE